MYWYLYIALIAIQVIALSILLSLAFSELGIGCKKEEKEVEEIEEVADDELGLF